MIHRFVDMPGSPVIGSIPFVFGHFDSGLGFNVQRVGVLTATPGQDPTNLSVETANSIQTPRVSPDGQWVIWTQAGEIRGIRTDGTAESWIWTLGSTGFSAASNPNWSVDGSSVIFTTLPASGTSPDIWTIPFDGTDQTGNETSIYTDPSARSITDAFYTYNGAHIIFSVDLAGGVSSGIWSMTAAATGASQLETQPVTGFNPLTPKFVLGKAHEWIAWNDGTSANPVWKRMDVDGTNVVTLITFAAGYRPPYYNSWASDDSVLYYARDTLRELWSVTNDGVTHTLVYDNGTVAFRESAWVYPGADRIYAAENLVSSNFDIISVLSDGSGHRVEATNATGHYTLI